jgi:hypothetical protein
MEIGTIEGEKEKGGCSMGQEWTGMDGWMMMTISTSTALSSLPLPKMICAIQMKLIGKWAGNIIERRGKGGGNGALELWAMQ